MSIRAQRSPRVREDWSAKHLSILFGILAGSVSLNVKFSLANKKEGPTNMLDIYQSVVQFRGIRVHSGQ